VGGVLPGGIGERGVSNAELNAELSEPRMDMNEHEFGDEVLTRYVS
jgi:hypothetical protein